jgi:tetratricopeptide (TPR) repeat protein
MGVPVVLAIGLVLAVGNRLVVDNVITNPGFESGAEGWEPSYGVARLAVTAEPVHSGQQAIISTRRSAHYCGPEQSLLNRLHPGRTYVCSGWVRVQNGDDEPVKMTIRQRDANGRRYHLISTTAASSNLWRFFSGRFEFQPVEPLQSLAIYFEGPGRGVDLLVDDVKVEPDRFLRLLGPMGIGLAVMAAGAALGLAVKRPGWSAGCGVAGAILAAGLLTSWLVDHRSAVVVGPRPDSAKIDLSGQVIGSMVVATEGDPAGLVAAGQAAARLGDWAKAFQCFQQVLAAGSAREVDWSCANASALAAGDTNACLNLCRQMMDRFGQAQDPSTAARCAKQCLVVPGLSGELLDRAVERAEFSVNAQPNDRWRQLSQGMAEYRRGQWSNALEWLRQPERSSNLEISSLAWPFIAMAQHQLSDTNSARQALEEANSRLKVIVESGKLARAGNTTWDNYARAFAVRAEAERLILGGATAPPADPAAIGEGRTR